MGGVRIDHSFRVWSPDQNIEKKEGPTPTSTSSSTTTAEGASIHTSDNAWSLSLKTARRPGPAKKEMIVYAVVDTGAGIFVIPRNQIATFLCQHKDAPLVVHSAVRVFNAVDDHLLKQIDLHSEKEGGADFYEEARTSWWETANSNRLADTGVLWQLVTIATDDSLSFNPTLETLTTRLGDACLPDFDVEGVVQMGEGTAPSDELSIGLNMLEALTISRVYQKLLTMARQLSDLYTCEFTEGAIEDYGILTHYLQTKSTIVLDAISRRGIAVNPKQTETIVSDFTTKVKALQEGLDEKFKKFFTLPGFENLAGKNPSRQQQNLRHRVLSGLLTDIIKEHEELTGESFRYPAKSNGDPLLAHHFWKPFTDLHPFIEAWVETAYASYLLTSVKDIQPGVSTVYPRYTALVRNGRTACADPNIQHIPNTGGFRDAFVAREGKLFLMCDFDFAELVTLAAVCRSRYGYSVLGDTIDAGRDPHAYTAALIENMPFEDFMALSLSKKPEERTKFRRLRQRAKALNFGVAGGLGVNGFRNLALEHFDVFLTTGEANYLRKILITHIYPEIGHYLYTSDIDNLAERIQCDVGDLWDGFLRATGKRLGEGDDTFKPTYLRNLGGSIRNVMMGVRQDCLPYSSEVIKATWHVVSRLNNNPDFDATIASVTMSEDFTQLTPHRQEVIDLLFKESVATITGRVRRNVSYTQARNTAFSGLAADAAKIALWNLHHIGYNIVAFIHDEVIVEINEDDDVDSHAERVSRVMSDAMTEVTGIDASCHVVIANSWAS